VTDFTYYCQDVYGINIDLSDADVTAITKENLESATIEYNRKIQRKSPPKNRALIIVGVQNDLCEDGVKAYPKSIETILKINEIRDTVAWDLIVRVNLSLPLEHGTTTPHCVSGSLGSNNHPYLKTGPSDVIVYSRSASGLNDTPVDGILKRASIDTAYICGIPSEFTSLAATTLKKGGITTALIHDATCGGESLKQLQVSSL
jgi:nicotinamidase-related amidase